MTLDAASLLQIHLEGAITTICHCWRLTRKDGIGLGFTDHDRPLTVDGTQFQPESGLIASEARASLGLASDEMDVSGALMSETISARDIEAGLYDGAKIVTLLANWREPAAFLLVRSSVIGRISSSGGKFTAELSDLNQSLDRQHGRYFSRGCDAVLGDARCAFDLETPGFRTSGVVNSVESENVFTTSSLSGFKEGWFDQGTVSWSSGELEGRHGQVISQRNEGASVRLIIEHAAFARPAIGDSFVITAGCDKRFATCKAKFANSLNFQGFPHLPGNDAAYAYASEGQTFDGGPLVP